LQRERKYDDELQTYDRPHPSNAPEWSYVDQGDILYDTEIEQTRTDEEYVTEHEEEVEVERDIHRRPKIKMTTRKVS
jgi:hypothetical protein